MNAPEPIAFKADWPDPDPRFLREELPPPPELPLADVLAPRWAAWVAGAAEAKGAPPDYVLAGLLAGAGAVIGNARWASPWPGWKEPPVLWTVAIGSPSSGKSPGLDAVLAPLQRAARALRQEAEAGLSAWRDKVDIAKLAESTWKEAAKTAIKEGKEPPAKPRLANPGPKPAVPRLCSTDSTVEKLAVIVAEQPRGTLLARDELAGWLQGMTRYSGGCDRPFWLEAWGGRNYTVERMGREPVHVDRLSIGVVGGIQPDRLRSLLLKSDDDGLLARFLPFWPHPAPVKRPMRDADDAFLDTALARLLSLDMVPDDSGNPRPWLVPFSEEARGLLDDFRRAAREWEAGAEGLLLSFIGKLPGLAVRMSLVLAFLDWATEGDNPEPREIGQHHFGRAAHLVEAYALPMARRAYAGASGSKAEHGARRLVAVIREQGWTRFTSRDVLRLDRVGLGAKAALDPALALLDEGDCIRPVEMPASRQGGRPARVFTVNPALLVR